MEETARTMLARNEHSAMFARNKFTDFEVRIGKYSYSQDQSCIDKGGNQSYLLYHGRRSI